MSVPLPWVWQTSIVLRVTKLEPDGFGRTSVEGTIDGEEFAPFTLPQDVSIVGADALKNDIDGCVREQISDGLKLNR